MNGRRRSLRALREGDVELLEGASFDAATLADGSIQAALRQSADRVVFHRLNYRATIQRGVEVGVPCDLWTKARAGELRWGKHGATHKLPCSIKRNTAKNATKPRILWVAPKSHLLWVAPKSVGGTEVPPKSQNASQATNLCAVFASTFFLRIPPAEAAFIRFVTTDFCRPTAASG